MAHLVFRTSKNISIIYMYIYVCMYTHIHTHIRLSTKWLDHTYLAVNPLEGIVQLYSVCLACAKLRVLYQSLQKGGSHPVNGAGIRCVANQDCVCHNEHSF